MRTLLSILVFSCCCLAQMPKHVRVNGTDYHLVTAQSIATEGYDGVTDCDTHLIKLAPGQSRAELTDTVWHETQHAIQCEFEGIAESDDQLDAHDFIYEYTGPELKVLRDNPKLVKFLAKDIPDNPTGGTTKTKQHTAIQSAVFYGFTIATAYPAARYTADIVSCQGEPLCYDRTYGGPKGTGIATLGSHAFFSTLGIIAYKHVHGWKGVGLGALIVAGDYLAVQSFMDHRSFQKAGY